MNLAIFCREYILVYMSEMFSKVPSEVEIPIPLVSPRRVLASKEDILPLNISDLKKWLVDGGIPEPVLGQQLLNALDRLDTVRQDDPDLERPLLNAAFTDSHTRLDHKGDFFLNQLLKHLKNGGSVSPADRHELMQLLRDPSY